MTNDLKSNQLGELSAAMTATPQALQSTNAGSPSTLDTSVTTAKAKSPKDSQHTPNLQDAPNATRLILALAAKLGTLVEWKKLTLVDGREVYALVFPVSKWQVDPETKELQPR
jgi:hypothetical protein